MTASSLAELFTLSLPDVARIGLLMVALWVVHSMAAWRERVARCAQLRVRAATKAQERDQQRGQTHQHLQEYQVPVAARREFLLSLTAADLHRHMHDLHDVTCEEVVLLYSLRALAIGKLTNCVTEEFYLEALTQAKAVDQRIAARKAGEDDSKPGILEGVPLSVKECIDQQGADSTCGFSVRCFQPHKADGLLVQLLRDAGAIPFVRTNVPQALMVPETMNDIWGVTLNPWNLERTPGGSSGGEGALLAARGSVLGIGSDIGGSLRIPAHFCGLYTLKPTPARLTFQGLAIPSLGGVSGMLAVRPVAGPMAHCVDDLTMMMRAFLTDAMWKADPFVPRTPLDNAIISGASGPKKLKIGYYEHDGWFEAAPACARAVRQAVVALEELGHECVRWTPPDVPECVRLYYGIMSADAARGVLSGLDGEDVHASYKNLLMMLKVPRVLKKLVSAVLRMAGEKRAAMMLQCIHEKTAEELYGYHAGMLSYIATFTAAWQDEEFDAVICPGVGVPALLHGGSKDLTVACSYTFLYNLLHFPAGSVPIGLTESHEVTYESSTRDEFTRKAVETCTGSVGMPVGVQVVGLPFADEIVLRVMKELEQKVHFKDRPAMANDLQI